jgi:hypothetical protein
MGEIAEAARILQERKMTAGAMEAAAQGTVAAAERVIRLAAVGLDLDLEEVREQARKLVPLWTLLHVTASIPAGDIAAGSWSDGLMTGLLVAERRTRGEGS